MNNPIEQNRAIQAELQELCIQGILTESQRLEISQQYPVTPWDLKVLGRWMLLLGVTCTGIGGFVLLWNFFTSLYLLEGLFLVSTVGFAGLGHWLKRRHHRLQFGAAVELFAGFSFTALTTTLGVHYGNHSGHWSILAGFNAGLLGIAAYLTQNRLLLIYACINLFTWFGGETGYESGWGAYWLGMTFPLRFLLAGALCGTIGIVHIYLLPATHRAFASFGRVYIHFGLFIMNLAWWFLSLFGYFEIVQFDLGKRDQRLLFSVLWTVFSAGSLFVGLRFDQNILRSYGAVFLIINLYTFYCQFVVAHSLEIWWLHLLVMGGGMIGLGIWLERIWKKRVRVKTKL